MSLLGLSHFKLSCRPKQSASIAKSWAKPTINSTRIPLKINEPFFIKSSSLLSPISTTSFNPQYIKHQTHSKANYTTVADRVQQMADFVSQRFTPIDWMKDFVVYLHEATGMHSLLLLTGLALSVRLMIRPFVAQVEKRTAEVMGNPEAVILSKLYHTETDSLKKAKIKTDLVLYFRKAQSSARMYNILLTLTQLVVALTTALGIRRAADLHPEMFESLKDLYALIPAADPTSILPFSFALMAFITRNTIFPFMKLKNLNSIPLIANVTFYSFIFCIPMLTEGFTAPVLVYWNISAMVGLMVLIYQRRKQHQQAKLYEDQIKEIKKNLEDDASSTPNIKEALRLHKLEQKK